MQISSPQSGNVRDKFSQKQQNISKQTNRDNLDLTNHLYTLINQNKCLPLTNGPQGSECFIYCLFIWINKCFIPCLEIIMLFIQRLVGVAVAYVMCFTTIYMSMADSIVLLNPYDHQHVSG